MDATYFYYMGPVWPLPPHALLGREVGYGILVGATGLLLLVGLCWAGSSLAEWWWQSRD